MCLDKDYEGVVYVSIPLGTAFEIVKYTIGENDEVSRKVMTKYSELNNIRPYKIKQGPLVWMSGDYYYWIVNSKYPQGFPTGVWIDGDAGERMFEGGIEISCTADMNGVIYKDDEVELVVDDTRVVFCGRESQNPLSTSDWNKAHNATTDGSKKLVRPEVTQFRIVKENERYILLRWDKIDVVVTNG